MRNRFLPLVAMAFLALACNNAAHDDHKTSGDTASKSTIDTSQHRGHTTTASADVPPLPEIPATAKVYFKNIKDGSTVKSPLKIEMGVDAMALDTANGIIKPASGHHHILIGLDSMTAGVVVPKDSVHLHYGNAQSAAEIKLPPGKHKLTLQFADALHRSYGSKLTSSVTVTVKE